MRRLRGGSNVAQFPEALNCEGHKTVLDSAPDEAG